MDNDIFINNDVRDYIKEVNNSHKNNYLVTTEAMNLKLYVSLCKFMENIYIYDNIDKKNTLKNYIINMICSDKFDIETKQNNLNIFIESISPVKDINNVLKDTLLSISNNIYNILEKDNIEDQKKYINKLLGKYFNNNNDKKSDIELHNIIKKQLNNNKEDAKLYLEFFKIIECNDEYCNNPKVITDYKKESSRFSLIRDNDTRHVKLLEIFNGKDVKIIVTDEEIENINKYKSSYNQFIENIMTPYYDQMVKIITNSWGWVMGENNNIMEQKGGKYNKYINVQYGGNKNIIDSLYNAVKDIFKYFIKMGNEYGSNIYNFISSYFNGKDSSSNNTIKNKNNVIKIIGNTSDSHRIFIKKTLFASFTLFTVITLVKPDMVTKAVGSIMENIKIMVSNIITSIKNYTINKILGEASDAKYANKMEEYKIIVTDKIQNYTEDASLFINENFGIKTELKEEEKLDFVNKKMLDLSNDIKINEFKNFYDFIVEKNIIGNDILLQKGVDIKKKSEYLKYFDIVVNIISEEKDNSKIIEYYKYLKDIFKIEPNLESDIDKIKYMTNEVITLTNNKKKEYFQNMLDNFKKFDIEPKIEDNDYVGRLQNVIGKLENCNDDNKMKEFIDYIEKDYKIKPEKPLKQKKNIISELNKKIIEKFKSDENTLKIILAKILEDPINIQPSLDTDGEIINNLLEQLKKKKEEKSKEINEDVSIFLEENFEMNTELTEDDKLDIVTKKMSALSDEIKKKEFKNLYEYCLEKKILTPIIFDDNNDSEYLNNFNKIVDMVSKLKDKKKKDLYYKYINYKFNIKPIFDSEFDKLKYVGNNLLSTVSNKKKEYIENFFKKFDITPKLLKTDYFGILQNVIGKLVNGDDNIKKDAFIKYMGENYGIKSNLLKKQNIIYDLNKKIIEKFKDNNDKLKEIIKFIDIIPSLDTESEKISNMTDQLKKIKDQKIKNYTEDVNFLLKETFEIKTEEKIEFATDKMLNLSDVIKKEKFLTFYENLIIKKILDKKSFELNINEKDNAEYINNFNIVVKKISELTKESKINESKINEYYDYINTLFNINVNEVSEFDKLKYMANNVINEVTKKKNDFINNFLDYFEKFDIKPELLDDDYLGKLKNVISKLVNENDNIKKDAFIKYIGDKYGIKSNYSQLKYKINDFYKQIIEKFKNDNETLKNILENINIKPSLDTDIEKINYMTDRLKIITDKSVDKIGTVLGVGDIKIETNNDKLKYAIYKIKNSDVKIKDKFIKYLDSIGIKFDEENDEEKKEDSEKEREKKNDEILKKLYNIITHNYYDKIEEIIEFIQKNEDMDGLGIKLTFDETDKNGYMVELFTNKEFGNIINDEKNEIVNYTKDKLITLAEQYAIEFTYFTNNNDKLDDINKKIKKLKKEDLKKIMSYITEYNTKNNITNTVDDTDKMEIMKEKILDFIEKLKENNNFSEKFINYYKDNDIIITKNFTNNIEKVFNIYDQIKKKNIKILKDDDEFIKYINTLPKDKFNTLNDFKNFDYFNRTDYLLYFIDKNYNKQKADKYLTNNIEKINNIIDKFKSINNISIDIIENNKKYKFLHFFDDYSIKPDIYKYDKIGDLIKNTVEEQCKNVFDKIKELKNKNDEMFVNYNSWMEKKIYEKCDYSELLKKLYNHFKTDCFGNKEYDNETLDIIYKQIIECENGADILIDFINLLMTTAKINSIDDINEDMIENMSSETDKFLNYIKKKCNIEPSLLNDSEKFTLIEKTIKTYIDDPNKAIALLGYGNTIAESAQNFVQETYTQNKTLTNTLATGAAGLGLATLAFGATPVIAGVSAVAGVGATGYGFFNYAKNKWYGSSSSANNKGGSKYIVGGGNTKCYTIDNLKQILLKILVKITESVEMEDAIPPGEPVDCNIDMKGKSYILKKISLGKEEGEKYKKEMQITKNEYIPNIIDNTECLKKTNLFNKNSIKNKNILKNIDNKFTSSVDLTIVPNGLDILKDSVFIPKINYQIGGNVYDINRQFIKSAKIDIDIEYSYGIVSLLQKALLKINNNNIYLEEKTIKDIEKKINILKNSEIELYDYAIKIVNANKINYMGTNNKITLQEYNNKHKILLEESNKKAIKLNKIFLKLLELYNN